MVTGKYIERVKHVDPMIIYSRINMNKIGSGQIDIYDRLFPDTKITRF